MQVSIKAPSIFKFGATPVEENTQQQVISCLALSLLCAVAVLGLLPAEVMAFAAPAADSPGYGFYDLAVNDIIKGPVGQAGGVYFMARGASEVNQSPWKAGATVIAGGCLFQAESLSQSFGFPVQMLTPVLGM